MPPQSFLLRFQDRSEAMSILTAFGIGLDAGATRSGRVDGSVVMIDVAFGDGIFRQPTGETAEFEGEPLAFTAPTPGYHVVLSGAEQLPPPLRCHVVEKRDW